MLDSAAAVAAERQGKNARQLLEAVALKTGDDGVAVSVITILAACPRHRTRRHT